MHMTSTNKIIYTNMTSTNKIIYTNMTSTNKIIYTNQNVDIKFSAKYSKADTVLTLN